MTDRSMRPSWPVGPVGIALRDVYRERVRQDQLKAAGRFELTCADAELPASEKLAILVEEVGEVARAVLERADLVADKHGSSLRDELIQVAAVALAWAEGETP